MKHVNRKPKLSRAKKAERNHKALMAAAAEIIGEVGYEKASIAKITDRAGLAQGTFYLYFDDRQALFDQLLPIVGLEMLDYLRAKVDATETLVDREYQSILATQAYFMDHMWFMRVLHEARAISPMAYREHMNNMTTPFLKTLKRCRDKGEIKNFTDAQLESLSYVLVGVRDYLFIPSTINSPTFKPLTEEQIEGYMTFFKSGILQNS